jgi:uncharacterized OsmC-like protein
MEMNKTGTKDDDLLEPTIDPNRRVIGIRRVSAVNEASTRSVMRVREHTLITDEKESNTGSTPLEMALASLLGCEGVIINRCAQAMRFSYSRVEMTGEGEVDQRGSRGVRGVRPYFNWVRLEIKVFSDESADRFSKLTKNVEFRCPVMNLFRCADVEVKVDWKKLPTISS